MDQVPQLFGCKLETDDAELTALLSGPQVAYAKLEKLRPGLARAATTAMKCLNQRQLMAERLVVRNGAVTAYPPDRFRDESGEKIQSETFVFDLSRGSEKQIP